MDGRIGEMRCCYQMFGDSSAMASVKLRLDRLSQTDVMTRCETSLDTVFADDPTVYVMRHLKVNLTIADGADDFVIAKHWGEQIVRAVVEVTDDTGDTQNLMIFRDQADYVAHFLMDLTGGQAWDRWFYGAFASLENLSTDDALRSLLDDNQAYFGQIMAYLYQYDGLNRMLSILDSNTLRQGWASIGGNQQGQPAQIQPLFALAFHLVDVLGWWEHQRPDERSSFEAYMVSSPLAPDWRDSETLLQAVISVLLHLTGRGLIRLSGTVEANQVVALRQQYDWLDFDKLLVQISALSQSLDSNLPLRAAKGRVTPRQRTLLEALKSALQQSNLQLDGSQLGTTENAVRLLAILLNQQPQWSDDSLTAPIIENLVQVWALLVKNEAFKTAGSLTLSHIERLLSRVTSDTSQAATRALHFLSNTGEGGLDVLKAMLEITTSTDQTKLSSTVGIGLEGHSVDTACAGSFLLVRAILDARLPMLLDTSCYPTSESMSPVSAALLTLALYWSGRVGLSDNAIDPGLLILAGLEQSVDLNDLRQIWASASPDSAHIFQRDLLHLLIGQRVLSADSLTIHRLHLDEHQTLLIAGSDTARLWPFNAVVRRSADEATILSSWLVAWEAATGQSPNVTDVPAETENSHLPNVIDLLKLEKDGFIESDLTMILTANTLLLMWARWLGQFSESSIQYLLTNFIRRPGTITLTVENIFVELDAGPLDIVLQMAGYLAETGAISWLGNRRIHFHIREHQ